MGNFNTVRQSDFTLSPDTIATRLRNTDEIAGNAAAILATEVERIESEGGISVAVNCVDEPVVFTRVTGVTPRDDFFVVRGESDSGDPYYLGMDGERTPDIANARPVPRAWYESRLVQERDDQRTVTCVPLSPYDDHPGMVLTVTESQEQVESHGSVLRALDVQGERFTGVMLTETVRPANAELADVPFLSQGLIGEDLTQLINLLGAERVLRTSRPDKALTVNLPYGDDDSGAIPLAVHSDTIHHAILPWLATLEKRGYNLHDMWIAGRCLTREDFKAVDASIPFQLFTMGRTARTGISTAEYVVPNELAQQEGFAEELERLRQRNFRYAPTDSDAVAYYNLGTILELWKDGKMAQHFLYPMLAGFTSFEIGADNLMLLQLKQARGLLENAVLQKERATSTKPVLSAEQAAIFTAVNPNES